MKTAKDPRHLKRVKTMQDLFAFNFNSKSPGSIPDEIVSQLPTIDRLIAQTAPSWPIEKINKIDLAILRLAVYELTKQTDIPPKVVVDEAVEIAKEYGSESSPSFVNGVLGKLISLQSLQV